MDLNQLLTHAVREAVQNEVRAALAKYLPVSSAPAPERSRLLKTREAATRAGVTPATIRRWIEVGDLPTARTKHGFRIDEADLDAFLRRLSDASTPRFDPERIAREALFR